MYELKEELNIEDMIYEIRGRKVIFDRDLAKLYNVETRVLNQKVKRNIDRFPEEFCFQLDRLEFKKWISQFVISNDEKMSLRKLPYVFTEQGVAMLSAIIKSDIAVKTSIQIMNAFVKLRKYVSERGKILPRRITGNCAKHQRALTVEIKKARHIAIMPYVTD